ncbi:MAG: PaaI family thioesterase [Bacteroidota bacterium]|jgi:acyl-coenzyme A thioesterase PaaI-like protein
MGSSTNNLSRYNRKLFLLGLLKIPILGYVRPKLRRLDDTHAEIFIRLSRRTKNHLGSMYFGALTVGADAAAGIHVFYYADKFDRKISVAFKSMSANFLKRPESDVVFRCEEGELVRDAIQRSISSGQRRNQDVNITAFNTSEEIVATFILTVSVKVL